MSTKPTHIPPDFHTVTPFLLVHDAAGALAFYQQAFDATELMRAPDADGRIQHAEIKIDGSLIMLGERADAARPAAEGLPPVSIHLYVEDVDSVFNKAIAAGATALNPVQDLEFGDREGSIRDPFGIVWWIATHQGDLGLVT